MPIEKRGEFNPENIHIGLPAGIPFELYMFWRSFNLSIYGFMTQEEFFNTQMFRFEYEFVFQNVTVEEWQL